MKKYIHPNWQGHTNTIGYVLWCALNEQPDLYHYEKYGEHVSEWGIIL